MASSKVAHDLDSADALLQTDPAAAYERLNAIDLSEFSDSATMARWALLYSEALVTNNIAAPSDTIIDIALDYYSAHRFSDEYLRAGRLKAMLQAVDSRNDLATALYLQKEREYRLFAERLRHERIVFAAILILIAAGAIISAQRRRLKAGQRDNERLIAEASDLQRDILNSRLTCARLESRLSASFAGRFDTIDQLCQTYYEQQGTKTERKAIADSVKSQIEALKNDETVFSRLEACVDTCHGDILSQLRSQWPDIKTDDYRLFVFLACRLSNRTIALLLGESIDVVYKRKSRLKARIAASGMPHRQQFLGIFQPGQNF